jgi:tetratricopeptide (TPR) repeat protein
MAAAAHNLIATEQSPEDVFDGAEALSMAGRKSNDYQLLREAADLFGRYATRLARSRRSQAEAWERMGEALYFNAEWKTDSISYTEKAVALWPRPHWMVHLAARRAELGRADQDSLKLLLSGLKAEPLPESYERAVEYLRDTAESDSDYQAAVGLAEWIGDTYANVASVEFEMADYLSTEVPEASLKFIARASDLSGGMAQIGSHRTSYLTATLKVAWKKGDVVKPLDLAKRIGLFDGNGRFDPTAYTAFEEIGDYRDALAALGDSNLSAHDHLFHLGVDSAGAGRREQAEHAFSTYLKETDDPNDVSEIAEARVSVAEIRGSEYAQQLLAAGWDRGIDINAFDQAHFHFGLMWEARLRWVAGEHARAISLLRKFLSFRTWDPNRWRWDKMLVKWQSES